MLMRCRVIADNAAETFLENNRSCMRIISFVIAFSVLPFLTANAKTCPRCSQNALQTDRFCSSCRWDFKRPLFPAVNSTPSRPVAVKSNAVQPYHRQVDRTESRNRIQKDKIFTFSHHVVDENESGIITPLKFSIFNSCSLPSDDCCRVYGFDMALWSSLNYEVAGIGISALGTTSHSLYGLSVAFVGLSEKVYGIQIGWLNVADELYGLQIGFFNYAGSESCGLQIGVINVIGSFPDNRTIPVVNMNF